MQVAAGSMSDFTGVLIQRHYKPGNKYIQLVFETAEGVMLSLSRNIKMVRSLTIGQAYRVRGQVQTVGDKTYIHEPIAVPVKKSAVKRRKSTFIILAIIIAVVGIASAAFLLTRGSGSEQINAANVGESTSQTSRNSATTGDVLGASTAETEEDAAALHEETSPTGTTQTTANTTAKKPTPKSNPVVTTPQTPPAQPETPVVIPPVDPDPPVDPPVDPIPPVDPETEEPIE